MFKRLLALFTLLSLSSHLVWIEAVLAGQEWTASTIEENNTKQIRKLEPEIQEKLNSAIELGNAGRHEEALKLFNDFCQYAKSTNDKRALFYCYYQRGISLHNLQRWDDAIQDYNRALKLQDYATSPELHNIIKNKLNIYSENDPDNPEINLLTERAIELDRQNQNIQIKKNQAESFLNSGNHDAAAEAFGELYDMALSLNDNYLKFYALSKKGVSLYYLGKMNDALLAYDDALQLTDFADEQQLALLLENKAAALSAVDPSNPEIDVLSDQAIEIYRNIEDLDGLATSLTNRGARLIDTGKTNSSLKYLQEALEIRKELKEPLAIAHTQYNLASAYRILGQIDQAINYAQQSLENVKRGEDKIGEAYSYNQLASFYDELGDRQKALEFYQKSIDTFVDADNQFESLTPQVNKAGLLLELGDYEEARKTATIIIEESTRLNKPNTRARALEILGGVEGVYGNRDAQLELYYQAQEIWEQINYLPQLLQTINNIALIETDKGNFVQAKKLYDDAYKIALETNNLNHQGLVLGNIGLLFAKQGNDQEALQYHNQSLEIAKQTRDLESQAASIANIASVLEDMEQFDEALSNYEMALELAEKIGNVEMQLTILGNLYVFYKNHKSDYLAASQQSQKANTLLLELRRAVKRGNRESFVKRQRHHYVALVDSLIKLQRIQEAFEWANLVQTFELADYDRLVGAEPTSNSSANEALAAWQQDRSEINALEKQQREDPSQERSQLLLARIEANNQQAEALVNQYPELADRMEITPTDLTKLQKSIPENVTVLQPYLLTDVHNVENTVALFILSNNGLQVKQVPIPATFPELADSSILEVCTPEELKAQQQANAKGEDWEAKFTPDFARLLTCYAFKISNYNEVGQQKISPILYDLLIRPIVDQIPDNHQLGIIATGQLQQIPFETLYDNQTNQYLLQKYPVYYLTRLSKISPTPKLKSPKVLVFANPLPSNEPLEGTEAQADFLQATFPNSQVYKNEQATLNAFKQQALNFPIIHLGTHGCYRPDGCPDLGMEPFTLLFANNQQYELKEASKLGLTNTELVTLGACETARDVDGVGLAGLAYLLERAGAKTTLANLWNATDAIIQADSTEYPATEILNQFYANWQQGMTKAEAMQKAKLAYIDQDPFFWGPFILIGDGQ